VESKSEGRLDLSAGTVVQLLCSRSRLDNDSWGVIVPSSSTWAMGQQL